MDETRGQHPVDSFVLLMNLVEDERNLTQTSDFDRATVGELRTNLGNLVNAIRAMAQDDGLWDALARNVDRPLANEQIDMIVNTATPVLPGLLTLFGYRTPPPPPAQKLVDDTVAALVAARRFDGNRQLMLERARRYYYTLAERIQRDLAVVSPLAEPSVLRHNARRACEAARSVMPVAIPLAARAIAAGTATAIPGVPKEIVQFLLEHGMRIAANAVLGKLIDILDQAPPPTGGPESPTDLPSAHIIAMLHELGELYKAEQTFARQLDTMTDGPAMVAEMLRRRRCVAEAVRKHSRRIAELLPADSADLAEDLRATVEKLAECAGHDITVANQQTMRKALDGHPRISPKERPCE